MKKMNFKNLDKKQIVIGTIILVVIIIAIILGVVFFGKKKDENVNDTGLNESNITYEMVTDLYRKITKDCEGALVFDVAPGSSIDVTEDDFKSHCQKENHYTKLFGYTDSEDGAIVDVKVAKKENNQVYSLEGTLLGEYSDDSLSDLLDKSTTYRYIYVKDNEGYKLSKLESLKVETFEEE